MHIREGEDTMDYQNKYNSLGPGFEINDLSKSKKIPVPVFLFLMVSVLLAGVSMGLFPETFSDYKVFRQAEERIENGETSAALQELYEVQERHPNSLPVTLKLIELSMDTGYYDLAAFVFNEYLVGKNLSDGQYAKMMRYSRWLDSYYLTYDAVEELMAELNAMAAEDESQEAIENQTEWFRGELAKLHEDENQDQAFLYYYEAITAQDEEEYYNCLKKAYAEDPELFDLRVLLGNAERSRGNMEEAEDYLTAAVAKDKRDAGALRGLAVLAMLEDDFNEGLVRARQAYEADPDSMYVRDTYLIALHVNGDAAGEQAMMKEIEDLEGSLDEDTKQLLDGTMTLQEYYMSD